MQKRERKAVDLVTVTLVLHREHIERLDRVASSVAAWGGCLRCGSWAVQT
jgi:hypothetical protein